MQQWQRPYAIESLTCASLFKLPCIATRSRGVSSRDSGLFR